MDEGQNLGNGSNLALRNFGVFDVVVRKANDGGNPRNPDTDVPIPAHATVKFKAGKEMKAAVLKPTPKVEANKIGSPK